jgi:hypothetical protein
LADLEETRKVLLWCNDLNVSTDFLLPTTITHRYATWFDCLFDIDAAILLRPEVYRFDAKIFSTVRGDREV